MRIVRQLVELALLLGSDYTDGIKGVGGVLALEILGEFHASEPDAPAGATLRRFAEWVRREQQLLAKNVNAAGGTGTLSADEVAGEPDTPLKKRLVRGDKRGRGTAVDRRHLTARCRWS